MYKRKVLKCVKALQFLEKLESLEKRKNKSKNKKFWVSPYLLRRQEFDLEAYLLKDLQWEEKDYKNFCRMSVESFEILYSLVENLIKKNDTPMRYSISARIRLALILRFVASGDSYRSLEFLSRVSRKTISKFVPEVLRSIYSTLQPSYLKIPNTQEEWLQISEDFKNIWHFPHTLGAIDGKHVRIIAPTHSGSTFYNYKGFFSIVLFALVDAHSRFIFINVGANGKSSDSTIFQNSYLYKGLNTNSLKIPNPSTLLAGNQSIPYFFIGDDAFALDKNLMKPYNRNIKLSIRQEAFNYRLCRARMTVEMAFGRLANRFRIFHRPIEVSPDTCDLIVKACCVIHNFLTKKRSSPSNAEENVDENLPSHISPIAAQHYNTFKYAYKIRDLISLYCITEGNVEYQWRKINK